MQNSYSQNGEDLLILNYYENNHSKFSRRLTVVEFGANNGTDLSNSRLLIEEGFSAILIEPSNQFEKLKDLYVNNLDVTCLNVAVSDKCGTMYFYESGAHVLGGKDQALVSTLDVNELKRWPNVEFKKRTVNVLDVASIRLAYPDNWDVISIDCESMDWIILKQIDLNEVGCQILCVEYNSIPSLAKQFTEYCAKFGMKETHRNSENLIFAR